MRRIIALLIILNFIIVFPSIRFFSKFLNIYFFVLYVILFNAFLVLIISKKEAIKKILSLPIWSGVILILGIANYFIYPIIDARKKTANSGSTGDDAMILAANSFKNSGKMYDVFINNHTPISPGPAWVIFNTPFSLLDLYFLFSPFYVLVALLLLKKYFGNIISNLFLGILFSALITIELFLNGHDILPFSLGFLICTLLIFENFKNKLGLLSTILISFLLGIVCTSRVIFFFVPFVFYFLTKNLNQKKSLILLTVSSMVFWGFNGYYYAINQNYQPLHLIQKSVHLSSLPLLILGSLAFLIALFFIIKFLKKSEIQDWFLILGSLFALLLIPVSIADLYKQDFNFKLWEGANYFMPIIPFLALYVLFYFFKPYQKPNE